MIRPNRFRAGITVIEVAIALAVLGLILGAVGMTVLRGNRSYGQGISNAAVEGQARRMLEQIVARLIDADRSSIVLTPPAALGGSSRMIDFARARDWTAGALVVGPVERLRLSYAAGEIDDGLDNNGNGLVDECRLELLLDAVGAPTQVTGCGGFVREYLEGELPNGADDNGNGLKDERGLCFTYDASTGIVAVHLTIERVGPDGQLITRTAETSVQIRND